MSAAMGPLSRESRVGPERTCVGCRGKGPQRELLRVVRSPGGEVSLDVAGRSAGRGAYLHRDRDCVGLARRRRALQRALRCPVPDRLWPELEAASSSSPA